TLLLVPETRANLMCINSELPTAQHNNLTFDSIYTARRLDSTQAIMKWQLALGLLLFAAMAVAMPTQEEKAHAERVLEETLSNLDESSLSQEQSPKLKKKFIHIHFG
ncbi:hypothetical protein BOX15_Mlig022070g2, partial [Macrostomum lignano]